MEYSLDISRSICSFTACISLLILCLFDLSIGESALLKSPTIIVLLFSFLWLLAFALHIEVGSMLGTYMFTIIIFSSWIDPLISMNCPFLSLVTIVILKSICPI